MLETVHVIEGTEDRLIGFPDALEIIGVSRSSAYRLIAEGKLPQPIKVGGRTFFSNRELQSWIAGKLATRNQGGEHD